VSPAESRLVEAGGLRLHAALEGDGPPLLVLHGFTGSTESMEGVAAGLRDSFRGVRLDLVGHGRSDAPELALPSLGSASLGGPASPGLADFPSPGSLEPYTMESCVAQVAGALDALGIPQAHVLGYSMGGRVGLALCAWRPERVRSALLIGASAGLEEAGARAARRRQDEALAERIEREGLERFVDWWMELPLFASQRRLGEAALARARAQRLSNRAHGLAQSLRGMGTGAQPALHARLPSLCVPILLVAGSLDAKFAAIASDLASRLPDARAQLVPGAGHACHLEQPEAFLRIARRFFDAAEARRRDRCGDASDPSTPARIIHETLCCQRR
jgi:2-succinyl-6-hydroxy-2,4-cyclohexadiene-1-carboxylate synthase